MTTNYILMVEDNPDDVTLTLRSFKRNHFPYEVVVARDGAEALDHLFAVEKKGVQHKEWPALVLLDLNLPKVTGMEVLRRIRESPLLKNMPVVILSSSSEAKDRTEAQRLGADLYLRKPIALNDFGSITEQIKEFLATRLPTV